MAVEQEKDYVELDAWKTDNPRSNLDLTTLPYKLTGRNDCLTKTNCSIQYRCSSDTFLQIPTSDGPLLPAYSSERFRANHRSDLLSFSLTSLSAATNSLELLLI